MYGTIFSQCLHDLDILDQLTAASLTEVLLTQFAWVERVGCLEPIRNWYFSPPIFNHSIMRQSTASKVMLFRLYGLI